MIALPGAPRGPDLPDLPDLGAAVELLERSLGHTRMALAAVRPGHLALATPCSRWDLDDLLWHMDDALDAFTEASAGHVDLAPPVPLGPPVPPRSATGVEARLARLQSKACRLLGAWTDGPDGAVSVGGSPIPSALLVGTAALEIAVHGWDVGRATGERRPIPTDLAHRLMPLAGVVVGPADRARRFSAPVAVAAAAPADLRLLGFLGRTLRVASAA